MPPAGHEVVPHLSRLFYLPERRPLSERSGKKVVEQRLAGNTDWCTSEGTCRAEVYLRLLRNPAQRVQGRARSVLAGFMASLSRLRSPGREALMALCLRLVVHFFVSSSCGQFLLGQLCPLCRFGILPQTVSTVSRLWLLLSPTILWLCRRLQVS